ncbi:SURF1 family protein [Vibrio sonorensis]|uniref:SURF1 family protein n=1 Tax=Vibrio sonorensis TaxID=1004316 RepID=UPI001FE008D4|nr:SURF1 family protein [Vibrio sonorensis]
MVKLGLWQQSRGYEKQILENQLKQRARAEEISLTELPDQGFVTGIKVKAKLSPLAGYYLLLDNQVHEGRVGYLAYQLMKTEQGKLLLLERGFIKAPLSRSKLPEIDWLQQTTNFSGRIYQKSRNPLSDKLSPEPGDVTRVQNLNLTRLAKLWGLEVEPYIFQPQQENWPYAQPWQPIPMESKKHFGYSFQWFAMATALLFLSVFVAFKWFKRGQKNGRQS